MGRPRGVVTKDKQNKKLELFSTARSRPLEHHGKDARPKKLKEYMLIQKKIAEEKKQRKLEAEKKILERTRKRRERNICMQKVTKKGQPVMKHRIKLLLKELTGRQSS
ncbi:unnamed protein product [Calicophoron daubneyi]|uniref:rRNA-processing protein FYV7 n=1 Tax=Calicophoron daubneyi TaxID=300641 RepID=A0AAV2T634_CALDB